MRHAKTNRRYGKTPSHRRAMFRNMATSFLDKEQCYTTVEKAKDLRRIVEPLITLAKKDTLHSRRAAYGYLMNKKVVQKLFADISLRFKEREGGYLRIIRANRRHGDAAYMAYVELVNKEKTPIVAKEVSAEKAEKKALKKKSKEKKDAAPKTEKSAKTPAKAARKAAKDK